MIRLSLLLLLLSPLFLTAQTSTFPSTPASAFTYLIPLTNEQVLTLLDKGTHELPLQQLAAPIDSVESPGQFDVNELPNGYYLEVRTLDHYEVRKLLSSYRWQSFVINNDNDLAVVVMDSLGRMIPDAEVRVKNKVLAFDPETNAYRHDRSNKRGVLTITHQGHTDYYQLTTARGRTGLGKIGQRIAYTPPIRWIWRIPYRLFADPIKSISWRSPTGWVRAIMRPFEWGRLESRTKGYFVLNQPKYRPGDTVKFKALVLDDKGRPVDKPIELMIGQSYSTRRIIDTLLPYRPGAFEYELILHDSLNLKLDVGMSLILQKKIGKIYTQTNFQLEDYELKEVNASFTSEENQIYRGEPCTIKAHMTDQNDLNVPGARLDLSVVTGFVMKSHEPQVFVPDTLWKLEQVLDPIGSTNITLPDSIFPAADLNVILFARFTSVDGEVIEKTLRLQNYHDPCRLSMEQTGDSVLAKTLGCGSENGSAILIGKDASGRILEEQEVVLPSEFQIREAVSQYILTSGERTASLNPSDEAVLMLTRRTADSMFANLLNPHQLDCWIEVFREDKSIMRAQGNAFAISQEANSRKTYHISLSYFWAGTMKKRDYSLQWDPEAIQLKTTIPDKIFPGEETEITLSLSRNDGTAVEHADVTAYALTSSFPTIPYATVPFKSIPVDSRKGFNQFSRSLLSNSTAQQPMDYWLWAERFGIDSLTAYQFLYPQSGRETFYLEAEEEETQISVFVVKDGIIQPIRYLVLDAFPVFVAGLQRDRPYSFPTFQANHKLLIRTTEHLIEADSVWVKDGMKAVFVVDLDHWSSNTRITDLKPKVLKGDREFIRPYVFELNYAGYPPFSFLEQGHTVVPVRNTNHYYYNSAHNLYGPFRQSNLTFTSPGEYSLTQPFEPGYAHTLGPSLWKMKSRELRKRELTQILRGNSYSLSFNKIDDEVLRKKTWLREWEMTTMQSILKKWSKVNNPSSHEGSRGKIVLVYPDSIVPVISVLTSSEDQITRIYPENSKMMVGIKPGNYRLDIWQKNGLRSTIHSIEVDPFGSVFIKMDSTSWTQTDSVTWNQAVSNFTLPEVKQPIIEFLKVMGLLQNPTSASFMKPTPNMISSVVLDAESQMPLIGATVLIAGTTKGAFTDENGKYNLHIEKPSTLIVSYLGYMRQSIKVQPNQPIPAIYLLPDNTVLDEVVVTGYSSQSKSYYIDGIKARGTAHHGELTGIMGESYTNMELEEVVVSGYSRKQKAPEGFIVDGIGIAMDTDADGVPDLYDKEPDTPGDTTSPPSGGLALAPSSLRSNFHDYAYWKPSLRTDGNGNTSFTVTFPDDITQWEHRVLAYDFENRRGADLQASSLSYLPLMARLSVPRFLVEGDSSLAFGKVQNVTGDSLEINLSFVQQTESPQTRSLRIGAAALDTLEFVAPQTLDSMSITFRLEEEESDFFDGEKRDIPLFRRGDRTTEGQFWMLLGDTTVNPTFSTEDSVDVTLHASLLDVLLEEMDHIDRYPYYCNEQAASKLKVLLMEKRVRELMGETFTKDHKIKGLIRRLQKNTNEDQLWGWWAGNETLPWITMHVLEALLEAEANGFTININKAAITSELELAIQRPYQYQKIDLLILLNRLGSDISFEEFITEQEADTNLYLTNRFRLIELRQDRNMPYELDSLWKYQLESVRGQLYWPGYQYSLRRSNTEATLLAYRILKKAGGHEEKLQRIQGWLLAQRQETGYWLNTYTSSRVLETILPDLLVDGEIPESPLVTLSGETTQTIREYPFTQKMALKDVQSISKQGTLPVYASVAQTYFETEPVANDTLFSVTTSWENKQGDSLQAALAAGQTISLWVEVTSHKSAEYVQIDVPIPGGCSYAEQGRGKGYYEVHREQRRDRVAIFCKELPIGTHKFEVKLQARYPGVYTLNPARVEEMYFPVFFGRTGMGEVMIE